MQFYNYVGFSSTFVKMACFVAQPVMIVLCFNQLFRRNSHALYKNMQWILVSLLLSFFTAWLFWGQNPVYTYRISATMFSFLFFFYLCKTHPSIAFLENFVLFFGFLYCVLWLYAFSQVPNLVFGMGEDGLVDEDISRGIIRLRIGGGGFVVMSLFLSVNKFYATRKKYYLALAALFFVFIVLPVTRQIIAWSSLVTAGYIYQKNKKLSIAVVVIVAAFWLLGNGIKIRDDSVVGSLVNVTERQLERNETDEDIRITEYRHFFTKYSKNIITSVIGNGLPHAESPHGRYNERLRRYGLYLSDVGYAEMYVVTGVLGLVLYILLFFKAALTKVPDELAYVRMFMIYMIPANIAASWYTRPAYQLCMAICIYIIMEYGQNKKGKLKRLQAE